MAQFVKNAGSSCRRAEVIRYTALNRSDAKRKRYCP
jgi:hypothetical protein